MPSQLDKQLYSAIELLNSEQKKAVLGIVRAFSGAKTDVQNHWDDENFLHEMESRYGYYKSGGKMITADEANEQIASLLKEFHK